MSINPKLEPSKEAEQAVIGGIFIENKLYSLRPELKPNHFFDDYNRIIFENMIDLFSKKTAVDPILLSNYMADKGNLTKDLETYMFEVMDNTSSLVNYEAYVDIVIERSTNHRAKKEIQNVMDNNSPSFIDELKLKLDKNKLPTTYDKFIKKSMMTLKDFWAVDRPEIDCYFPWLPTSSLSMIYAQRGVGKTYFSLTLAIALASGDKFMNWPVKKNGDVLYLDGEMSASVMEERTAELYHLANPDKNVTERLYLLSHEDFNRLSNEDLLLQTKEMQHALLKQLDANPNIRVLILDNLSSLLNVKEDKADDWREIVLPFLLACRRRGLAVIIIHHEGKSGDQRGSSMREDQLNTSIRLIAHNDEESEEEGGAEFKIVFKKKRDAWGKSVKPRIAKLFNDKKGLMQWNVTDIDTSDEQRVTALVEDAGVLGIKASEVARQLELNDQRISYIRRKLIKSGEMIASKGQEPMKLSPLYYNKKGE